MVTIRSTLGLASLLSLAASTAWAQNVPPAIPPALPAPAQVDVQARLPAAPPAQVRLYRLHNAPADLLAEELYAVFAAQNVRVAADPRTNSVIVGGPPAVQANIAGLIARLDVPQQQAFNQASAPSGPTVAAGNVPFAGQRTETVLNALKLLGGKGGFQPGEKIAVVKISPATARALEAVAPQSSGQAGTYQTFKPALDGSSIGPPQLAGGPIQTLTLSHDEIIQMQQALKVLSARGANGSGTVIVPSKAPATTSRQGTTAR